MIPTSHYQVTLARTITSETRKLFTLKSTLWVLGSFVLVVVAFSALMNFSLNTMFNNPEIIGGDPSILGTIHLSDQIAGMTVSFGGLILGILGALTVTNEFASGLIRPTLSAVPARWPVLASKALVLAVVTAVVSVVTIAMCYLLAQAMISVDQVDMALFEGANKRVYLGTILYCVAMVLLGLFIGTLVRATAGAIAIAVGITFVLPMILGMLTAFLGTIDTATGWRLVLLKIFELTPANAGTYMVTYDQLGWLEPWKSGIVLAAWVVLFAIAAFWSFQKRDV
jgi:ABC-2 type transport system permease protein